jgi:hypothetical protein
MKKTLADLEVEQAGAGDQSDDFVFSGSMLLS